jgi:Winged helix DNA-binding domain
MRTTLHLAAADDYPAYAQLARQARMRTWRRQYAHLDEAQVVAELGAWLGEPRTNAEIRERVGSYEGVTDETWAPINFARTVLPLVQLPPAGYWRDSRRASFVVDARPLPDPADAATLVLARYLGAFGPASRRDVAAWAGVAQRDFAAAWERLETVAHHDERGSELRDLPGAPLPAASTPLPPRLLAHWDQALLAYADRERIFAPGVEALGLTLTGEPSVTVDGRVAASWKVEREANTVRLTVTPHTDIPRAARAQIRAEAERTARFCEPDAARFEVTGV